MSYSRINWNENSDSFDDFLIDAEFEEFSEKNSISNEATSELDVLYLKGKTQWKTPSDEVCIFDGIVEKNEL